MGRPWVPRPVKNARLLSLHLGQREGYLLSRIDGATDVDQLAQITGLAAEEVRSMLARLVSEGGVEPPDDSPPAGEPSGSSTAEASADEPSPGLRQLFEVRLRQRSPDEREALAGRAADPELSALCFDPVPAVIRSVLENTRVGLAHARLIAAHHQNGVGLEAVAARPVFVADREVQRLLLRNNQTPDAVVRRMLASRRLAEVHTLGQSHELPERHRATARSVLRSRFASAAPEERVELIVASEGRVLAALTGLALDGRSVALLCARSLSSTLLVENLARWPATPPPLIAHLLKHPLTRQSPSLAALLRRHANCPRSEG